MADISVGSVLQTDLPHDHMKAFSEEVPGGEMGAGLAHVTDVQFKAVVF